jgi:DNA-binding transcriptional LysR family regulator
VALGLHAHRRYLETHGTPRSFDDLKRHALIGCDQETPVVRSLQARGMRFSRDMFALRTDSALAHLAAIRAGYCIGVCQVPIGRRDADLVRLLPRQLAFDLEIWLVMHENLRASPRMRAVFDHLGRELSVNIDGEQRTA